MSASRVLETTLASLRADGRKVLVTYLMGGLGEGWVRSLEAAAAAGADALEVGIPFSDPMIDGPVIQEAGLRAIRAGTTPSSVLDGIAGAALEVPVAVMTYYNIVFRAGHRRMARELAAAGVTGAIIADLPLEEVGPWAEEADAAGVATVLLVAPSTPHERTARICRRSRGFVYAVSRMGVTGERERTGEDMEAVVSRIRAVCDAPVLVGVGISTPGQAQEACRVADGVVVGSALVRRQLEGGGPEATYALVASFREAIDASR